MPNPSAGRRILIKVVQQYGAADTSARLGITPTLLSRLVAGAVEMPDSLLIKIIDLLPEDAPSGSAASGAAREIPPAE